MQIRGQASRAQVVENRGTGGLGNGRAIDRSDRVLSNRIERARDGLGADACDQAPGRSASVTLRMNPSTSEIQRTTTTTSWSGSSQIMLVPLPRKKMLDGGALGNCLSAEFRYQFM